ncbi:MAG TPA: hypothetical protein VEX13_08715 [Chloroflexia bacterium]|nr:hypothetical protein [Chloroflexia bacterium]
MSETEAREIACYDVSLNGRHIGSIRLMPDGWMALGAFVGGRFSSKEGAAQALADGWVKLHERQRKGRRAA